jgi:hypothetical protein
MILQAYRCETLTRSVLQAKLVAELEVNDFDDLDELENLNYDFLVENNQCEL